MKCICGYEQEADFDIFTYDKRDLGSGVYSAKIIKELYVCPKCGTVKTKVEEV